MLSMFQRLKYSYVFNIFIAILAWARNEMGSGNFLLN